MKSKKKFKNLFKKLKKTNVFSKYIFLFILILYFISISLLTYSILLLTGIETFLRIIFIFILIIYLLFFIISSLVFLISKKTALFIIINTITLLFSAINSFAFYYINKTYNIVDDIKKEKIVYTTNFITLNKEVEINTIGLINKENDIEGYVLPQEYIATNNKKYKIEYYEEYELLLDALYKGEVDGIFITANYILKYASNEKYENIQNDTKIIDTYSKKLDNQDSVLSSNKDVTEPFSVLLLGVDSEFEGLENNSSFNGDSIMLITFNPKTLSATIFSIPRDTYVPIACNNNKSSKINSAAAYGTKCVIDTVKNLTDINIDYYVKINFKGVVSLVDALDGITLNIDKPDFNKNLNIDCKGQVCEQNSNREFGNKIVYITPGENITLNGEQALAYARNRHQWAMSDFKRIEHQQAVVTAIANKAKTITSINTLYKLLNAISNNIDTNMETKQILNFYNVGKNILLNNSFSGNTLLNIQKTYLTGYDLYIYQSGMEVYTYQYYEESLNEIIDAMKENLEIKKPELIKDFSFSVNKQYEIPVIGKKYSNVKKNETLPNFIGKNISFAKDWLSSRNISLTEIINESTDCENGTILNQNVHAGTLTQNISTLEVTICKKIDIIEPTPENNNNDYNTENNNTDTPEIDNIIEDILE